MSSALPFMMKRRAVIIAASAAALAAGIAFALFPRWSEDELRQIDNLRSAMIDVRAAIGMVNDHGGALEPSQADQVLAFYERAAVSAAAVDDAVLEKVHRTLPLVWHTKLQRSTESYVQALKLRDRDLARQAALLQDDWIRWYNLNHEHMNLPPVRKR